MHSSQTHRLLLTITITIFSFSNFSFNFFQFLNFNKDMCTNDLYLCKDSSRINCTLACSTLGYIPCRNYVDKKICSSVNKKSSAGSGSHFGSALSGSGRFFSLKTGSGSSPLSFLFDSNEDGVRLSDTVVFSLLGVLLFASLVVVLVLFGVFYNRNKRKKKAPPPRSAVIGFNPTSGSSSGDFCDYSRVNRDNLGGSLSALSNQTFFDDVTKNYSSLCRSLRHRDEFNDCDAVVPPRNSKKTKNNCFIVS